MVNGIYFDGRKDKTLVQEKKGEKYCRKTVIEEHIVLVSEPGSTYVGHVTTMSGSATHIKSSIFKFLQESVDLSTIVAVGCDGTVVNTGAKNGIIRQLEVNVKRPLQWFICLLHANELPLRHLLQDLDGKTTGPTGFSGHIGKLLESCEKLPVVKFEKIEVKLPTIDLYDLSTDQNYLYELCNGISEGTIPSSLSQREPGRMSHARWLTTANRILRLYVATTNSSEELIILTTYIVKVYASSWFDIRSNSSCKHGSKHLFNMIRKSRYLPDNLKQVIDPVIQRSGYFGHPENILLAMLTDNRREIRELGLRRIKKCRKLGTTNRKIREFKVPLLNFNAEDYVDLIDWQTVSVTEPPVTVRITNEELKGMIKVVPDEIPILKFLCHSQAVERCVKLVTAASSLVCGEAARDGFIRARIASRQLLPEFETKTQFLKVLKKE